ncbi:unnamed protein product [Phyllotreta striolata]|uniref:Alpha-amylase n=1 Tax=Phyllotreta striolata TaxID=444603 RepID=A0A9N9TNJ4_PHYSR|nr:unnamed protein product [Phyllotreta striolata]
MHKLTFLISLIATSVAQFDPHFAKGRRSIVHLFEWTWTDIAMECESFLRYHGYGGVQISPPSENLIIENRPWFERYQPVSYVLKTRSGDEDDFKTMTKRCNDVGVRIYVDAVINHMSTGNGIGTAGNEASGEGEYPGVPYTSGDFHRTCTVDYSSTDNIRNCQLEGLRDLNHSKTNVREKIVGYLNRLIDLGVAGFRIDAARHMWPDDLRAILRKVKNLSREHGFESDQSPLIYLEVNSEGDATDYADMGLVTEFKFAHKISNVFKGNDKLAYLRTWGTQWGFMDTAEALVFVDNHDLQRNPGHLSYTSPGRYAAANAFMLAYPYGTSKIMSGYRFGGRNQGPPVDRHGNLRSPHLDGTERTCGNGYTCEHRWKGIYSMVLFKNAVWNQPLTNWWSNGDQQIAFCRGRKGFVAFTQWLDLNEELQTCLAPGKYCDIVSGDLLAVENRCTGKTVEVKSDGKAAINLSFDKEEYVLALMEHVKLRDEIM